MKLPTFKQSRQLVRMIMLSAAVVASSHAMAADRIHMEIVSAPVVPNGTVAGEPTEFNILLRRDGVPADIAMDPGVFGLQIPAGGRMEVELDGSFIPNPDFIVPFLPARNIIITTGPQNPVKPNTEVVSGGFWGVSFDQVANPNLVTIFPRCVTSGPGVPCRNLDADNPGGINGTRARALGFKVIHVRPNDRGQRHTTTPFYNGPAGSVGLVYVRIYDASGGMVAAGSTSISFRPRVGAQAHLTNSGTRDDDSVVSLTNYQHVEGGIEMINTERVVPFADGLPYAPQFLLFADFGVHDRDQFPTGDVLPGEDDTSSEDDRSYIPFAGIEGVTVVPSNGNPGIAHLVQYGVKNVGKVVMTGPTKKSGAAILGNDTPTTASDTANGSRLFVPVKVGNVPGQYTVTIHMNGGGTAVNTIIVE
jgi:hypothetical protein